MIKNYFKIAWRNLIKNKVYTIINVLGLSIGIATSLAIYLLINFELSYENFWTHKNEIYKITSVFDYPEGVTYNEGISAPIPAVLRAELPDFEQLTALQIFWSDVRIPAINGEDQFFPEPNWPLVKPDIMVVDTNYFRVFPYEWIVGNPNFSLHKPNAVVLTESKMKQYFGDISPESVLGKQIIYSDSLTTIVTGIVKDLPQNTDMNGHDFISFSSIQSESWQSLFQFKQWTNTNSTSQAFVQLSNKKDISKYETEIRNIVKNHVDPNDKWNHLRKFDLQPLTKMHFNTAYEDMVMGRIVDMKTFYILFVVAIFILILAIINFINLSTAQSFKRGKEIGIRKLLGGQRNNLIFQFLTETFLLTVAAVCISAILIQPIFALFSDFLPGNLFFNYLDPKILFFLILLVAVTTLLAGVYPAFMSSRKNLVHNLKNSVVETDPKSLTFGKSLIVFQFAIAQIFIICTLVMFLQSDYLRNKDMGIQKDQIVYFDLSWKLDNEKKTILVDELFKLSGVGDVCLSDVVARSGFSTNRLKFKNKELDVHQKSVDDKFINFYGLEIIAGSTLMKSDTPREVVVNEAFTRAYGYEHPEDAVGDMMDWWDTNNNPMKIPIVGVLKDFNFQSLHHAIKPLMIRTEPKYAGNLAIKLNEEVIDMKSFTKRVNEVYKNTFPNIKEDISLEYLDNDISRFYDNERNQAKLLNTVTFISILISCLGLLGLTFHNIQQKTKEIGIRKVLGASISSIVLLLSKNFLKLILISIVIAGPLAMYFTYNWLNNYAYSIQFPWWVFILGGGILIFIAMVAVSFQSIKAAFVNPIKSLRND
ncbi:MAG TPA: ABC transporter permease [Saprospiraceae bacterium]|nr:ABC transporter permease [Saprospiraceae bacterium]HPN69071.1 ABC transporter permease [Saprospiraceae bacterium]